MEATENSQRKTSGRRDKSVSMPRFDDVAWFAAKLLGGNIGAVVIVHGESQELQGIFGSKVRAIPPGKNLLDKVLAGNDPLVILNIDTDSVTKNDPIIISMDQGIRSFVGIPLKTSSNGKLGTLSVMGFEPLAEFTADHLQALTFLGRRIIVEFEEFIQLLRRNESEDKRFEFIAEKVEDLIAVVDSKGKRLYNNPAYRKLLGEPDALMGTDSIPDVHPDDRKRIEELLQETVRTRKGERAEYRLLAKDGSVHLVESYGTPITDASGEVSQVIIVARDITERRDVENAREMHLRQLVEESRALNALNEMANEVHHCNGVDVIIDAFIENTLDLFPSSSGALYLLDPEVDADTYEQIANSKWGSTDLTEQFETDDCLAVTKGKNVYRVDDPQRMRICEHVSGVTRPYLCVRASGWGHNEVILHHRLTSIMDEAWTSEERHRLRRGQEEIAVAVVKHLALAIGGVKHRLKLEQEADECPLTGLYSRHFLDKQLPREISKCLRHRRSLGLIMVDIDNFKKINEGFSHAGGDQVLRALGKLVKKLVRDDSDIACRYGGDELLLIMPEATDAILRERAENIREGAKRLGIELQGKSINVTLSLGIVLVREEKQESQGRQTRISPDELKKKTLDLQKMVSEAAFQAKSDGRDKVVMRYATTQTDND